jgi:signal transduction histidine kinase
MDIRKRLSIRFSLIVIALFAVFSASVYFFSSLHRKSEFTVRMKNRGITISQLLYNVKEMDPSLLQEIDRNTKNALYGELIYVFDPTDKIIYRNTFGAEMPTIDALLLAGIHPGADYAFALGGKEGLGFLFSGKEVQYKVIVLAYDELGFNGLRSLKIILLTGCILSIIISYLLGWIFSGSALHPISRIIQDVEKITETELNLRLDEGKRQDEIERLAITFNQMLDRIEKAFEAQKGFISNASHELRTPLTAMKGHIEVTLFRARSVQEYSEVLASLLSDIENLSKISNNLLGLAQATTGVGSLSLKQIRLDDTLFAAREELLNNYPSYTVTITMVSLPEEELLLSIMGNEALMKTAFVNLLENGCKYSSKGSVQVFFNTTGQEIELTFVNDGAGIPASELDHVFRPFYRASNVSDKPGSGLGLALTQKIIALHKGSIEIHSIVNKETTVKIVFPLPSSH